MKETIRKRQNAISLLSTGASFIPGVGLAVRGIKGILDGVDLFYGVSSSVKEQKEVDKFIQDFSDVLYETEMNNVAESCDSMFSTLWNEVQSSQKEHENEVYENL